MGKALLMAGELEQADDAFRLGMRKDTDKECRLGREDVHAVSVHLENAKRAVERNTGRIDAFKGALDEATGMGLPWAKKMTRQRQEAMEKKDRADQAYAAGRYRSAVDLFTEAIGVDEEGVHANALFYAYRAAALTNLGENKDALKDCEQALRLKPNYPEVLLRKARLLSRLGFWEEAVEDYDMFLLNSDVPTGTWELASSEMREARENRRKVREEQRRRLEEQRRQLEEQRRRREEEAKATSRARDDRASRSGGIAGASRSGGIAGGHYATLGLKSCATPAEVEKAYKQLALQFHPDKTGGDAALTEHFKEVNSAYEGLPGAAG
ncbi:unnamed protein product [Ascophyllum nodosum]